MKLTNKHGQVNSTGSIPKSTHKAEGAEKAPTRQHKKALTRRKEKTPSYYVSSGVAGVIDLDELKRLLLRYGQREWCTRVKLLGLLLLIEFFSKRRDSKGISCSADLARSYAYKIGRRRVQNTTREPLAVLCKIGVLRQTQPAVNSWHVKTSARYAFHDHYSSRPIRSLEIALPPNLVKKREQAQERYERRLRKRQPFRAALMADLGKLGFDEPARSLIQKLQRDPKLAKSTRIVVEAIDCEKHSVRQNPRGQITTSIGSCPRELKPLLLLAGQQTVVCDISHAHHCFLPRILSDRINHVMLEYGVSAKTTAYEAEREQMLAFLSEGDYYRKWCANQDDDSERDETKNLANAILNMPNARCAGIGIYQRMRRTFPLTFGIVEDIKRPSHSNISKPLQHYTARAIGDALLEVQAASIPAIPDVDAIICQRHNRDTVCEVIGRKVYEISGGVCCKVAGSRYSRLTSSTNEPSNPALLLSYRDATLKPILA